MGIDRSGIGRRTDGVPTLSGRARTALQAHQRRVSVLHRELQGVDRVLSGALSACDGASQQEMLGAYLEAVQELRVSLERLEGFLMQRLTGPVGETRATGLEGSPFVYGASPEASAAD
jgi:hypothetical protein